MLGVVSAALASVGTRPLPSAAVAELRDEAVGGYHGCAASRWNSGRAAGEVRGALKVASPSMSGRFPTGAKTDRRAIDRAPFETGNPADAARSRR